MYHLIYVSSAVSLFSNEELEELLRVSRRKNEVCGLSGMLLYSGGNFMQILEGDKDSVTTTHQRISEDPRHRSLITLLKGEKEEREFAGWSMGFRRLDQPEATATPGYSDFMNKPFTDSSYVETPSKSLRLLIHFRQNMR